MLASYFFGLREGSPAGRQITGIHALARDNEGALAQWCRWLAREARACGDLIPLWAVCRLAQPDAVPLASGLVCVGCNGTGSAGSGLVSKLVACPECEGACVVPLSGSW